MRFFQIGNRIEWIIFILENRQETFFSYTETEDEVSLILDEKSMVLFEQMYTGANPIIKTPNCYRAIQVRLFLISILIYKGL